MALALPSLERALASPDSAFSLSRAKVPCNAQMKTVESVQC